MLDTSVDKVSEPLLLTTISGKISLSSYDLQKEMYGDLLLLNPDLDIIIADTIWTVCLVYQHKYQLEMFMFMSLYLS